MTNKERLDAIKDRAMFSQLAKRTGEITHNLFTLDADDYDWLIEQAERVRELEETVEDYKTMNKELHQRGRKIRKQNKCYREAREIMEQVYKDNYVRNAYGYEDGYLDGLDTAMDIIDKSLEGESSFI